MYKERQNEFIVKVSCILASFCLWLYIYNVVSPIKNYKIKDVPVELINTDEIEKSNLALASNQEFYVTLSLRGTASEVHRITPDKFKVVADMSKYVLRKGEINIPVKVVKSPDNINIENSETLFINIKLDELSKKTVPVKVKLEGNPKDGYHAFEPEIAQTHVMVSGPSGSVDKVSFVEALGEIRDMDRDTRVVLPLRAVDSSGNGISGLKLNPENIEAIIPIKKAKSVKVKINTVGNVNDGRKLRSLVAEPDSLEIYGDEDTINNIDLLETEEIDLSSISESKVIESKVKLPHGVKIINDNDNIKIKILFDSESQRTFSLKVDVKNLNDGNDIKIEPPNVNLVVLGNENIIKNLTTNDIKCFVDVNSLSPGEYSLPVNIVLPDGVSSISKNPREVKATIIEQ